MWGRQDFTLLVLNDRLSSSDLTPLAKDGKQQNVKFKTKSRARKIKLEDVVNFTDNILGYDVVLTIGALADICEGKYGNKQLVDNLQFLQNRLKTGLATQLQLWLNTKGFVDREVCKALAARLDKAAYGFEIPPYDLLEHNKTVVKEVLTAFPSYYSYLPRSS